MQRYNPKEIEPKWQKTWEDQAIYHASDSSDKPKKYVLEYFPYPSGAAMHVGHVRNYTIGDAIARLNRMRGYNVLHPMGWDAFGLPAENYAIKTGISPRQAVDENTTKFKKQLIQMGFSYDWSREIDSTDPKYYRWTQWLFLLLFKRGLAYQQESLQWWCPHDKTVLANEQVEAGRCWRCGHQVEKKALKQWFFKITEYADRLLNDLDDLNWSDAIKAMQRNWIGRSVGAEVNFDVVDSKETVTVFTTRPDTLFGATFMVLAPEHPLVGKITTAEQKSAVESYRKQAQARSDIERQETDRDKTGVFTGAYATNPVNQEKIPIWVADYVLMGYGTGAIMAVPAHDERDHEFATKFDLPIKEVIEPVYGEPQGDDVHKEKIIAVVRNPKNSKVIVLDWGERKERYGGNMFIGGGVEKGEDLVEAAKREIAEETGYKDVTFIKKLTARGHGYFYSNVKNQNYCGHCTGLLFELNSEEKSDQNLDEGEKNKFTVRWIDADKVATMLHDGIHETFYRQLVLGECYSGEGVLINSGRYNGMPTAEARDKLVADLSDFTEDEPTFVDTFGSSAVREGRPFVERDGIAAIVKHWKDDKYIGLKWKQVDWETIITGGIEKGQTAEEAAVAEILQETGYKNPVLKKDLGMVHCRFFHPPKDVNRLGHFRCFYFELADDQREAIVSDEQAKHEVVWLSREEMDTFRLPKSQRFIWDKLHGNPRGAGSERVNYKIRDWLISRQRYWGAPIPIIHCPKDGPVAVPDDQLPVELPDIVSYEPSGDGRSPLANVPEFVNTTCPKCGGKAQRETDTMDGFACSSWYFLRFADPHNNTAAFAKDKAAYWLPVDDYIGGAEHAVMHLLYARFWTKVMYDAELINFDEPFKTLRNHGMILAPDGSKMSKSKGNTIEPDGLIEQGYGADAIRIMELFIGPWNQIAAWSVEGMGGAFRFLQRLWTLVQESLEAGEQQPQLSAELESQLMSLQHKTIKKVSKDLEELGFNTAIAAQMEYLNELYKLKSQVPVSSKAWKQALTTALQLLAPFAPHIAEELWSQLGNSESIHLSSWPVHDEAYLVSDTMQIVIQVNGKLRATLSVPTDSAEPDVVAAAKEHPNVAKYLEAGTPKKTIYVAGKLVNFVV